MAARRYEISLRVLKNYILFFRTRSGLVMFFLLYKRQCNTIFFQFIFIIKGAIYYVAIATVIFSHAKISRFARKLTWYFIGVYIIKLFMLVQEKTH